MTMHDPGVDPPSPFRFIHLLNAVLLIGSWWWSWWVFPSLPETIPGHFGPGGAIRWDEATFGAWFALPLVAAGMTGLSYALGPIIRRTGKVNLPTSIPLDQLLPEDRAEVLDLTAGFLHWVNAIVVGCLWLLQVGRWETATGVVTGMGPTAVAGLVLIMVVPHLATIVFLVLATRAVRDAEIRARQAVG